MKYDGLVTELNDFIVIFFQNIRKQSLGYGTCICGQIQFKFICIAPITMQSLQSSFTGN